jgi:hypothetical protein
MLDIMVAAGSGYEVKMSLGKGVGRANQGKSLVVIAPTVPTAAAHTCRLAPKGKAARIASK